MHRYKDPTSTLGINAQHKAEETPPGVRTACVSKEVGQDLFNLLFCSAEQEKNRQINSEGRSTSECQCSSKLLPSPHTEEKGEMRACEGVGLWDSGAWGMTSLD